MMPFRSPSTRAGSPLLSVLLPLALLLAAAFAGTASAQAADRVVVLPLDGDRSLAPWALAVSTGLQRTLNTIDGVFSPPVGDAALLADRARDVEVEPIEAIRERFGAQAILGGRVDGDGRRMRVTLRALAGGAAGGERTVVGETPAELLRGVSEAAVDLLGLSLSDSARGELQRVAAEAPSTEVLSALALASSRLPGADVGALRSAADLDADSSWVLSELARALSLAGDVEVGLETAERATEITPSDVEAWVVRGVVARRAGESDAARSAFEEALRLNPAHAVALTGLAEHQPRGEAIASLERAIELYPRLLEAHVALADLLDGPRAFQRLRAAGRSLPDSLQLHREVVRRALEVGDAAGALDYLRQTAREPLALTPGLFALATALPSAQAQQALDFLREGRERFPDSERLALAEGRLLREAGQLDEAVATLREVHEASPDDAEAANALALTLLQRGDVDEARGLLEGAAEDDATARFNLAQLLLESGRPRAAAAELEPDMTEGLRDPERWRVYGMAQAAAGRAEVARAALERALEIDPEDEQAQRALRRLEERLEVAGDAQMELDAEAMRLFDDGMLALEQQRFDDAEQAFARAREVAPGEPLLAFYHGNALQRGGQPRAALEAYEPALEAFGDSGTVLNNIGFAHLQLGRYDRALPMLRSAVEAAPDNARAHLNLGLTYYAIRRFDEALARFERALELEPELEPSIAEARERARRLSAQDGD